MRAPRANDPCWCGSGKKYKRCHREGDVGAAMAIGLDAPPIRLAPHREVPSHIARPGYAVTGRVPLIRGPFIADSPSSRAAVRNAGRAAREVLEAVLGSVGPGVTTAELDDLARRACVAKGGYPSTLNYKGYPRSICTSINEVICHGIPGDQRLKLGDIINCDVTIFLDGVHGDCSATVGVGSISASAASLIDVTRECLARGISAVRPGGLIRDIGRAIESFATASGVSVVSEFCGHGIGSQFHMDPQIVHVYDPHAITTMVPGMTFTIEPMLALGSPRSRILRDGWTAVTADGSLSAQFEETVMVTETAVEILTKR